MTHVKVFISWSGQQSKALAEVLRAWLPSVIQAVKPYFSPSDISKGSRWSNEIGEELAQTRIGIVCLTKENVEAPWILFEAGALSKSLSSSRVCPLLFDLDPTDVKGPLLQFQCVRFDKKETRQLLSTINDELGELALSTEVLDSVFEMFWPQLEKEASNILRRPTGKVKEIQRSDRDLVEEILQLCRVNAAATQEATAPEYLLGSLLEALCEMGENLERDEVDDKLLYSMKRMYRRLGRLFDSLQLSKAGRERIELRLRNVRSEIERLTGIAEVGDLDDYESVV